MFQLFGFCCRAVTAYETNEGTQSEAITQIEVITKSHEPPSRPMLASHIPNMPLGPKWDSYTIP